jgi:putative NADH-flavin reductase
MKLAVFGATGQTGREIVRQSLSGGHGITVLARDPRKIEEFSSKMRIVHGDSMEERPVEEAVAGSDAVLSALGHVSGSPDDLLSKSASNILEAMRKQKVQRLVVLTNAAARDSLDRPGFSNRLLLATLSMFRGTMARDTAEEAKIISSCELNWTIVRASLLTNGPLTKKCRVGQFDGNAGTRVSRADAADFMISCATGEKYLREKPFLSE